MKSICDENGMNQFVMGKMMGEDDLGIVGEYDDDLGRLGEDT